VPGQQVRDAAIAGDPGGGGDLPGVAVAPVRGASGLLRLHGTNVYTATIAGRAGKIILRQCR
jgi:hypothetical protein